MVGRFLRLLGTFNVARTAGFSRPNPRILEGGNALGMPPPLIPSPPFDTRPDGIDPQVVNPVAKNVATIPGF